MTSEFLKEKLRSIAPYEFEQFVANIWASYGYQTEVTDSDNDRGVDVKATRRFPYPRTEVIQVKRYNRGNKIGSPEIQQYSALRKQEDADLSLIVTTGRFSTQAQEIASELGVEILDIDRLVSIISVDNHYDLVAKYASVKDTLGQQLTIEVMTDELVENTGLDDPVQIRRSLVAYFESHPSDPSIDRQPSLNAFNDRSDGWEEVTTVSWSSKPSLDADAIAEALVEERDQYKLRTPTTKMVAVRAVVAKLIEDQLGPAPTNMSESELADWFVKSFDEELVPAVAEYPGHSRDIAMDTIDSDNSVAVNRLRVAEELEEAYRYDEIGY